MINIKIKPEERVNIECYLLMKHLLTVYYRVGKKQPFEFNLADVEPQEVSDFKVFTKPKDIRDLINSFKDASLITAESFKKGLWVSLDEEEPPDYKISLLPDFYGKFNEYEAELLKITEDDAEPTKIYRFNHLVLDMKKATMAFKDIVRDINSERREVKFLEKLLQKDGLVVSYLELAEHMNIQSYNKLAINMDVARDVQDIRGNLQDYISSIFSDKKISKEISSYIQTVRARGYKLKSD